MTIYMMFESCLTSVNGFPCVSVESVPSGWAGLPKHPTADPSSSVYTTTHHQEGRDSAEETCTEGADTYICQYRWIRWFACFH